MKTRKQYVKIQITNFDHLKRKSNGTGHKLQPVRYTNAFNLRSQFVTSRENRRNLNGEKKLTVSTHDIRDSIFTIRGVQVMIDIDLATLYRAETRVLNQAVILNRKRFPSEFMLQLTTEELQKWKSQIVISNKEIMEIRNMPFAFSEQSVAIPNKILRRDIPFSPLEKIVSSNVNIVCANKHE